MAGGALREAVFLALLASVTLFVLCPFAHAQPVPAWTGVPFTPPGTQAAVAITRLNPSSAPVGEPLILTVNGSGMSANSIVLWNGAALPTFYVSDSRLSAHVDSSLTACALVAGAINVPVLATIAARPALKRF